MKDYELYVKTSAIGQAGIHWRHIVSNDDQQRKSPELVMATVFKHESGFDVCVNNLLNTDYPSLLIFRDEKQEHLMLEVAGIEAPSRSERMGRRVLNLFAFIFKNDTQGERTLRRVAYDVIQYFLGKSKKLDNLVEDAIRFHEKNEFRVDLNVVENYIHSLDKVESDVIENEQQIIALKSNEYLEELAETIKKYTLPSSWKATDYQNNSEDNEDDKNNGVLLVVTGQLEYEDFLHYAGLWRGFATNVKKPKIISTKPSIESDFTYKNPADKKQLDSPEVVAAPKKSPNFLLVMILGIILVVSLITVLMIMKPKSELPNPQPTPSPQETSQEPWHPPLILN